MSYFFVVSIHKTNKIFLIKCAYIYTLFII